MKILINYASGSPERGFVHKQNLNCSTGLRVGGFDKTIPYNSDCIDSNFYEKNKHIFSQARGAGYWLWKPYIIRKTLDIMVEGDYLMYSDAGVYFVSSVDPLCKILDEDTPGIMPFHLGAKFGTAPECVQTKRDAYILMGCDNEKYWYENTCHAASYMFMKKNDLTLKFIDEYLMYCQDERILTDIPNQCGEPNLPEFVTHRHDQSIFSILVKKYNLKSFSDPSQYGDEFRESFMDYYCPRLVDHTR